MRAINASTRVSVEVAPVCAKHGSGSAISAIEHSRRRMANSPRVVDRDSARSAVGKALPASNHRWLDLCQCRGIAYQRFNTLEQKQMNARIAATAPPIPTRDLGELTDGLCDALL